MSFFLPVYTKTLWVFRQSYILKKNILLILPTKTESARKFCTFWHMRFLHFWTTLWYYIHLRLGVCKVFFSFPASYLLQHQSMAAAAAALSAAKSGEHHQIQHQERSSQRSEASNSPSSFTNSPTSTGPTVATNTSSSCSSVSSHNQTNPLNPTKSFLMRWCFDNDVSIKEIFIQSQVLNTCTSFLAIMHLKIINSSIQEGKSNELKISFSGSFQMEK